MESTSDLRDARGAYRYLIEFAQEQLAHCGLRERMALETALATLEAAGTKRTVPTPPPSTEPGLAVPQADPVQSTDERPEPGKRPSAEVAQAMVAELAGGQTR